MRRAFICLLLALSTVVPAAAPGTSDTAQWQEALVEVSINGERRELWALAQRSTGNALRIKVADLESWGIVLSDEALRSTDRSGYLALERMPGIQGEIDSASSRLSLTVQPGLLRRTRISGEAPEKAADPAHPGLFLNYDLVGTFADGKRVLGGLGELGSFAGPFAVTSTWLGTSSAASRGAVRLESALMVDFPASRLSVRVGDSFSASGFGAGSGGMRMAGLSIGTDFGTTPQFVPFPLPGVKGEAAIPSALELMTMGSGQQRFNVPAGPFTIDRIPVPAGPGEIRYMLRDALGREQTVTQRYFVSTELLRDGLSSWHFDVGAKRRDFGLQSDAYAGWLSTFDWRHGISDRLTGHVRFEADERIAGAGAQLTGTAMGSGLWRVSAACSTRSGSDGCQVGAGLEHQWRNLSAGFDLTHAAERFKSISMSDLGSSTEWQGVANVSFNARRMGSISLVAFWQQEHVRPAALDGLLEGLVGIAPGTGENGVHVALTATRTVRGLGHFSVLVSDNTRQSDGRLVSLQFTRPLEDNRTVSSYLASSDGRYGGAINMERNTPEATGLRYRLSAGREHASLYDGSLAWTGSRQASSLSVRQSGKHISMQASTGGAVAWLGGSPVLSRRLDQGFAVVRVGNMKGLPIYHDGRLASRTGANGLAVIPQLRPFEPNTLSIRASDLPLDMDAARTQASLVPYRRGGSRVDIPLYASAGVRLLQADGQPIPAGAAVRTPVDEVPVALDGIAFIKGKHGVNDIEVRWNGGICRAQVQMPAANPADLLEVICRRGE